MNSLVVRTNKYIRPWNVNRELFVIRPLVQVRQSRLEVNSLVVRTTKYIRPWNVNRKLFVTRPLARVRQSRLEVKFLLLFSLLLTGGHSVGRGLLIF